MSSGIQITFAEDVVGRADGVAPGVPLKDVLFENLCAGEVPKKELKVHERESKPKPTDITKKICNSAQ